MMVVILIALTFLLLVISGLSLCFGAVVFYSIASVGAVILLLALFMIIIGRAINVAIIKTIL